MKTGNDEVLIQDIQDERIWIHSKKLGYGCWITNKQLHQLVLENTIDKYASDTNIGCGKPLGNPFFVHWKCGENNLLCKECETIKDSLNQNIETQNGKTTNK